MTETVEVKKENFSLESIEELDGKFYVTGKALSQDFECETGLKALSEDIIKQPIVWRHRHPIDPKHKHNHIYGRVLEANVDDYLIVKAEIYGHTDDHKALRDVIRERANIGDPLSFSMHYRTYYNDDKSEKIHWDVFELSGTPFPACKTCQIENFIGEDEMPENEIEKKKLEDAMGKITELEDQLNSKTKVLEDLDAQVKVLEKQTESKDEELEDTKKAEQSLTDRVLELENYTKYLEDKKPIITEIQKYRKIDDRELEFYKAQDKVYLSIKLEEAKKDAENKIQTQTLEGSADEARNSGTEEDEKLEDEPSYEKFKKHFKNKVSKKGEE